MALSTAGLRAALGVRAFRLLMTVQLINAVAVWVHVVAVQWLLTERGESAFLVSLAPAAISVPFIVLALPVGALVGQVRRERLLGCAMAVSGTAAGGAALVVVGGDGRPLLLLLSVLAAGTALVVVGVTWQSMLPEIVSREAVPSAALVDGAVYNIARAVGPLVAGIILGLGRPDALFAVVATMFAACVVVLIRAGTVVEPHRASGESLGEAVRGALWFVAHSPWTTGLLVRMVAFGLPASALWALLSLAVHDLMGLGPVGFGTTMALLGVGAVAGALALGWVRARVSLRWLVAVLAGCYALTLVAVGFVGHLWLLAPILVLCGLAWVCVQSTWMMLAHQVLPDWVRPRVVAVILLVFQGTQALGALLWGAVADAIGVAAALAVAAAAMLACAGAIAITGLRSGAGIEPDRARTGATGEDWPETGHGPVVVRYDYRIADGGLPTFRRAMADLRLSRLRLGARSWSLVLHPTCPGVYVETYRVRDRALLLEQETVRLTVPELRLRDAVRAATATTTGPVIAADPDDPNVPRRRAGTRRRTT